MKLTTRQQEILKLGKKYNSIQIDNNKITYFPQNKSYIFSHPEEPIRAVTYIELVIEHKYPSNRIDFEVYPDRREPKLLADIVVYEDDEKKKAYIVVECKANASSRDIKEAKKEGIGNSNLLVSEWLLLACGEERHIFYVKECFQEKDLEEYRKAELPTSYGKIPKYRFKKGGDVFSELREVTLDELHEKFQKCHDAIWDGGKRDPAEAFDEMSKLMFAKIYDEKFCKIGDFYKFQVGEHESNKDIADRIKKLYSKAQEKEPDIFKKGLNIPDKIIVKVVIILQDISLLKTDLDAKGRAFEKFLGKIFRGELGQYFTPREITDFMVKLLNPNYDNTIIDPACGSGGFLLYTIKHVMNRVKKEYDKESSKEIIWDFSHNNVYGIEINDRIARIAMMDMVIHDDGHTNIECNDGLVDYRNYDPRRDIKANKYDFVLTNPPFGAKEEEENILIKFDLGKYENGRTRKSQKKEFLFIERCIDLVKPNGKVGIVIPDGILNNPTLKYVREFILKKAKIIGIISLPDEAFIPFGSFQKTSILVLEKKENENEKQPTKVFMAKASKIGYDATGKKINQNDLEDIILNRYALFTEGKLKEPNIETLELSKITEEFEVEIYEKGFILDFSEMEEENRWDVEHFRPKIKSLIKTLKELKCPQLKSLGKFYRTKVEDLEIEEIDNVVKYIENIGSINGVINYAEKPFIEIPKGAIYAFDKNTILISRINAKIGCVAIIPDELNGILGTSEYYGFIPNEGVSIHYIHKILRSEIVKQQIIALTNGLYKRLNEDKAGELLIPFSKSGQKIVEEAKKYANQLRKKADKLESDALKKAIEIIVKGI